MGSSFQSFDQSPLGAFIESEVGQARGSGVTGTLLVIDGAGMIYTIDRDSMEIGRGPMDTTRNAPSDIDGESSSGPYYVIVSGSLYKYDTGPNELWTQTPTGMGNSVVFLPVGVSGDPTVYISTVLSDELWVEGRSADDGTLVGSVQLEDTSANPSYVMVDLGLARVGSSLFALTRVQTNEDQDFDVTLYRLNPATLAVVDSSVIGTFNQDTDPWPERLGHGASRIYVTLTNSLSDVEEAYAYSTALARTSAFDFSAVDMRRNILTVDSSNKAYLGNDTDPDKVDRRDLESTVEDTSAALSDDVQAMTLVAVGGVVAPTIDDIADDSGFQYVPYSKTPTLYVGDTPVTWTLEEGPAGASINSSTGEVTYTSLTVQTVNWEIKATNSAGSDTEEWSTTFSSL